MYSASLRPWREFQRGAITGKSARRLLQGWRFKVRSTQQTNPHWDCVRVNEFDDSVQPILNNSKRSWTCSRRTVADLNFLLQCPTVKVQGFIIPLDMGDRQTRFLLSAVPPHCAFCMPAGPDAIVEVIAKTPVKYGFEPIVVSGRFSVLRNDATGVLYRLTDAEYSGVAMPAPKAPAP